MTATIKLGRLAEFLGATLRGSAEKEITGLATLQEAGPAQLSFLANPQYRKYLVDCHAGAVLLKAADAEEYAGDSLVVPDPYLAYARISHWINHRIVRNHGRRVNPGSRFGLGVE